MLVSSEARQEHLLTSMLQKDLQHRQLVDEHLAMQGKYIRHLEEQVQLKDSYIHSYNQQMLQILGSNHSRAVLPPSLAIGSSLQQQQPLSSEHSYSKPQCEEKKDAPLGL